MAENQELNSLGNALEKIARGEDIRKRIKYDEVTGDFILEDVDSPLEDGQSVDEFAREGYA